MSSPPLSVIISTRDRPIELDACLRALRVSLSTIDEIVVVDSASRDPEEIIRIASTYEARCLMAKRAGAARARNIGIRQASGAIVAFVDDDAIVDPDWRDALMTTFQDPEVSIVVGPVFEAASDPPRLLLEFQGFDAGRDFVQFSRGDERWLDRLRFGAIGSGANLAARRAALERMNYFREMLGAGAPISGDENFFLFAAVHTGLIVANQPLAKVWHPRQSIERNRELERKRIAYLAYLATHFPSIVPHIASRAWQRIKRSD